MVKYQTLFDGKLKVYPHKQVHLELLSNAVSRHQRAYPVAHIHLEVFKTELQQLCDVTIITREIENFHRSLPSTVKKVFPFGKRSNNIDGNIDYSLLKGNKKVFVYTHILDDFMQKVWFLSIVMS